MTVRCKKYGSRWQLIYLVILGCLLVPQEGMGQENGILDIGDHRELFLDHYLVEELSNVEFRLNHPHEEQAVLKFDKPWEGPYSAYTTIIKDKDVYRAYYRGKDATGKDGSSNEVTCYAESQDGLHWIKPKLDLYEAKGFAKTNVILKDAAPMSHNFSPFLDENPQAKKEERYKAIGGTHPEGLFAYVSEDGIHWDKLAEKAVFNAEDFAFDSQNTAFWSPSEMKYVCYFRSWVVQGENRFRSVSRTTSVDFIHWTEPVEMGFGDTPLEHLYTQQTTPYYRAPHIYVAIGARFMPDREVVPEQEALKYTSNPRYYKDCSDAYIMTTRGGDQYDRTFMESFIRPGIGLQNWLSRSNYPALNVVQTGDHEMSIYMNSDFGQPTAHLKRYTLRIDGFSSLSADFKGGEFITKPFRFSGKELEINYSTSAAGSVKVEIQDATGKPLQGYTLKDSREIIGNEISRVVSWNGTSNIAQLSGQPIKLKVYMKDADLYSIKFNE